MSSLLRSIHRANPHPFASFFPTSPKGWAAMIILYSCFTLGFYVVQTLPFFILYKKANVNKAWMAFVPVAQLFPYFLALRKSTWNILWFISPVIGFIALRTMNSSFGWVIFAASVLLILVLHFIWKALLFLSFGMSRLWLLLLPLYVVPIVGVFTLIGSLVLNYVMALGSRYEYQF